MDTACSGFAGKTLPYSRSHSPPGYLERTSPTLPYAQPRNPCSLRKRGATFSRLTCFTAEALQKIKSAMSYTAALLVVLLIAIAAAVATIIARHALDLDIR